MAGNKITVILSDKAHEIKERLESGFMPTKMVSAGLVLFDRLSREEQFQAIQDAYSSITEIVPLDALPKKWQGIYIPIINTVSAGLGANTYMAEYLPPGIADKYIKYDSKGNPQAANFYALTITGDSMAPEYKDGDIVVVDPNESPSRGVCVVLVDKDGEREAFIKDLALKNGTVKLKSLNEKYDPIVINKKDGYEVMCHKIVEHIKR